MIFISNNPKLKDRRKFLRNNSTNSENILWSHISGKKFNNLKFRRQHSFGPYVVDFYCREKSLVIEIDGDSHFSESSKEYDSQRTVFLSGLKLRVLRFTNDEVFDDIENVLQKISNLP